MADEHLTQSPTGEFVMFASDDGEVRVECRFEQETLWLPQATIANLYQVTPQAITQHIKAIYEEGELEQNATCKSYLQVQREGARQVSRNMLHYSLPVILAVGYRVRSPRGTQFRQWATQTLQEYLIKGFVMDDERLKNPPVGSSTVPDYFDEMLERIISPKIRLGGVNRCSCVTGRISWISSCNSMTARFYKALVPSVRKRQMKKHRLNTSNFLSSNAA